ncbi:MAG: hypothetical protein ACLU8Y_04015 [Clostridia bacterium]
MEILDVLDENGNYTGIKEERKKEYVFTKWNTFDRHIKLLKKQREKILELER